MADFPKVDRLKSQLITSGLQGKDPALFQIINTLIDFVRQGQVVTTEIVAASGGSVLAIDALNTDVVATGPGNVVATIQPDAVTTTKIINQAVTYGKIQNTVLPDILIGCAATPGTVQEIGLGTNLQIVGNTLEITTSGGGSGGLRRAVRQLRVGVDDRGEHDRCHRQAPPDHLDLRTPIESAEF